MSVNNTRNLINSFLHNAFVQGSINKKYGKSAAIAASVATYTALAALSYVAATYALAYQTNVVFLSMLLSPQKFTVGFSIAMMMLSIISIAFFKIQKAARELDSIEIALESYENSKPIFDIFPPELISRFRIPRKRLLERKLELQNQLQYRN